jgi:hypothetical protein
LWIRFRAVYVGPRGGVQDEVGFDCTRLRYVPVFARQRQGTVE